jgi:hypothetical protein
MSCKRPEQHRKRVFRLPDLDFAALNTLRPPEFKRPYRSALDNFAAWYCSEPRIAFSKTVGLRYRLELESRRLSSSTINVRVAAVRQVAYQAVTFSTVPATILAAKLQHAARLNPRTRAQGCTFASESFGSRLSGT